MIARLWYLCVRLAVLVLGSSAFFLFISILFPVVIVLHCSSWFSYSFSFCWLLFTCLKVHNFLFICLKVRNFLFICLKFHDFLFICLKLHNFLYIYLKIHNLLLICLKVHNFLFICLKVYNFLFMCLRAHSFLFICSKVHHYGAVGWEQNIGSSWARNSAQSLSLKINI